VRADKVRRIAEAHIEKPLLGFIGEAHVNVLALNRDLDKQVPQSAKAAE